MKHGNVEKNQSEKVIKAENVALRWIQFWHMVRL